MENQPQSLWHGAIWKLTASGCFALVNVFAHALSRAGQVENFPITVSAAIQYTIATLLLTAICWRPRQSLLPDAQRPIHLGRGMVSAFGVLCWYGAIHYLTITDAVALGIFGPLFVSLAAKTFLKETLPPFRLALLSGFFVVMAIMLRPDQVFLNNADEFLGILLALSSMVSFAFANLMSRYLAKQSLNRWQLTHSQTLVMACCFIVAAIPNWQMPNATQWLYLCGMALGIVAALYALVTAYSKAAVSFIALFDGGRFLMNAVMGFAIFKELPHKWAVWLFCAFLTYVVFEVVQRQRGLNTA